MERLIQHPCFCYLMSFIFQISQSTSHPSLKPYYALSPSFRIIVIFTIYRWERGLVWGMRHDAASMSSFLITFHLAFLASFPFQTLQSSGMAYCATLASLSFAKIFHGSLFLLLSVNHVNYANIFVLSILDLIPFLVKLF